MKRIFSFLFAIIALVGTTSIFTACQEDAPEINFTINVTVNNDFTEVVNAINNGAMKQEAAIAALTAAIEKMQGEQDAKLDAIVEAINTLATTLDAKLAIIEAAMKAQTLALETKLGLIEAAIKALPDYSDQLKAIEAAIKGMPDYSDQLAALETALEAIAANIEAQEGQYADELAALTEAIDAITAAVEAGNKSQEDALAEIIALLESGALAGGGSGSGSGSGGEGSGGEGSGGEGSGDEPTGPYISLTTKKPVGSTIEIAYYDSELTKISGVVDLQRIGGWHGDVPVYRGTLTSQEVKLYGTFTKFNCSGGSLTKIDTGTQGALKAISLGDNPDLKFNFEFNSNLEDIFLRGRILSKSELSDLVEKLPNRSGLEDGKCQVDFDGDSSDCLDLVGDAEDKGWNLNVHVIN